MGWFFRIKKKRESELSICPWSAELEKRRRHRSEGMYLKVPFWSKDANSESQTESPSVVAELISSLERQRLYREVTLALRTGLSDARAEFSFLRIRGLRVILKFLTSVAESDTTINLFCHSQSIPDLQGLLHSLHPRVSKLNDFSFDYVK